jgi:glycosyltransferase involved in cell wall biosynthesis
MCSGIPVISSGTPGLRENCGDAGIYVERNDIKGWVEAIARLDTPVKYRKASERAKLRSRELDPVKSLTDFRRFMQQGIMSYKFKTAEQIKR